MTSHPNAKQCPKNVDGYAAFARACAQVELPTTYRQYVKWRHKRGLAYNRGR